MYMHILYFSTNRRGEYIKQFKTHYLYGCQYSLNPDFGLEDEKNKKYLYKLFSIYSYYTNGIPSILNNYTLIASPPTNVITLFSFQMIMDTRTDCPQKYIQ